MPSWLTLAHALPGTTGQAPHVPLWASLLLALSAALVPFAAGWAAARRMQPTAAWLSGAAAGALLYLFVDFYNLTANLGSGLRNPALQLALLGLFLAGLFLPGRLEGQGLPPALLWAAGVGMHSLGEGIIMGYNMHLGWGMVLAPLPLISFIGHKLVEGVTVGLLPGFDRPIRVMALVALPAVAGAALGFAGVSGVAANLAYAAGAGAAAWALTVFLRAAGARHAAAATGMALGFAVMYALGVLHEI